VSMSRNTLSWLVVFTDLVVVIAIMIATYILPAAQVARSNFYNRNKVMISDFTVHLRHLDLKGALIHDEISDLLRHVENVLLQAHTKMAIQADQIIYDVNFPVMTVYQIDKIIDINDLEIEKLEMAKDGVQEDEIEKIAKINEKIIQMREDLKASFIDDLDDVDDVFITFQTQDIAKSFKDLYLNVSYCKRCTFKCCKIPDFDYL
jgi:hypothetical protein